VPGQSIGLNVGSIGDNREVEPDADDDRQYAAWVFLIDVDAILINHIVTGILYNLRVGCEQLDFDNTELLAPRGQYLRVPAKEEVRLLVVATEKIGFADGFGAEWLLVSG